MRTEEEIREQYKVLKDHIKFIDEERVTQDERYGDTEVLTACIEEASAQLRVIEWVLGMVPCI